MKVAKRAKSKLNHGSRPGPKSKTKGGYIPPGRPWNRTDSRICFICLRQYDLADLEAQKICGDEEKDNLQMIPLIGDPVDNEVSQKPGVLSSKGNKNTRLTPEIINVNFWKIISRFVGIKTKSLRTLAEKNKLPPSFCKDCFQIVQYFCDDYENWEIANMTLHWRLKQIADGIRNANLKVSGKLGMTLHKSLSTQLRMKSANLVEIFRKNFLLKCSAKALPATDGLQVSLNKNACHKYLCSRLKYPFQQMIGCLKSLIVVFALAAAPKTGPDNNVVVKMEEESYDSDHHQNEDDYDGGYSPHGSPARSSSPFEEEDNNYEIVRNSDSDWSDGGGGDDSDEDFSVSPSLSRRLNLRKRRNPDELIGKENFDEADDKSPGESPIGRRKRSKTVVNEVEKKFPCNICSLRFVSESFLKRHLSQMHPFILAYDCKKCSQRFKNRSQLDEHIQKIHPSETVFKSLLGKPTPCNECNKIFPSKTKLYIHQRQVHKTTRKTTCKTAHKATRKTGCKPGYKSIDNFEKLTCEICGKLVTSIFFNKHMRFHSGQETRPFRCPHSTCAVRFFATEDKLKKHLEFHEKNPDWVPPSRKREKEIEGNLEGISRKRKGLFMCDFPDCNRYFRTESTLAAHVPLHNSESTFPCPICKTVFFQSKELTYHMHTKHETKEKNYNCTHCLNGFTLKETLAVHFKNFHSGKLDCDVHSCSAEFKNTEELREHLKTVHLPADVVEVIAKVERGGIFNIKPKSTVVSVSGSEASKTDTTSSQDNATTTDNTAAGDDHALSADSTQTINVSTVNLEDELKLTHKKPQDEDKMDEENDNEKMEFYLEAPLGLYTCERCRWSFTNTLGLSLHLISHTKKDKKTKRYSCNLCTATFRMVDSLQHHYNLQHGPAIKLLSCSQCGKRFHKQKSYSIHMRFHEQSEEISGSFLCTDCGEVLNNNLAFQKHMMKHGKLVISESKSNDSENESGKQTERVKVGKVFHCDECVEIFDKQVRLFSHKVNVHGREKQFRCTIDNCNRVYTTKGALNEHKLAHGARIFVCPHCPKNYYRKGALREHLKIHAPQKSIICDICGKSFYQRKNLRIHMETHAEQAQYCCSFCGKGFKRRFLRNQHEKIHSTERPYKCKYCGEGFKQCTSRNSHQKIHENHGGHVRQRKRSDKSMEASVNLDQEENQTNHQSNAENVSTASGIMHEALQAAFNDITTEILTDSDMVPVPNQKVKAEENESDEDGQSSTSESEEEDEESHSSVAHSSQLMRSGRRVRPPAKLINASETYNPMANTNQATAGPSRNSSSALHCNQDVNQAPTKKRGRPPKLKAESRRSRLERIVENVMTTAATSSSDSYEQYSERDESNRMQLSQQQRHLRNHSPSRSNQSPQHSHTPSPHSSYNSPVHTGNEKGTLPTQNILQNQVTSSVSSATVTNPLFNTFLLSNPYLLSARPEASTTSQQSVQMQYPHQSQGSFGGAHPNHLLHQQQQGSNNLPRDFSKSSYPTFFANPRFD